MKTVKIADRKWSIVDRGVVIGQVLRMGKDRHVYYNGGYIGTTSSLKKSIEKVKGEMNLQERLLKVLGSRSSKENEKNIKKCMTA